MAFPPQFLDEIRARIGLAETIGRRVKLTRQGREHTGLCPFHNEKTPSFTVNEEKGFYHCFGCGAHGDVIGFVMRSEGTPFPEAVERLAAEAGLEVPVQSPEDRVREERRAGLTEIMEAAADWYTSELQAPSGRAALDYLCGRGLDDKTIAAFRLGFAPDGGGPVKQALEQRMSGSSKGRRIELATLVEAGLLRTSDDDRAPYPFFRNRIVFPITDRRGRVVAFGGRLMGEAKSAKYINSPDTPLFHKSRMLYNLAEARLAAYDGEPLIVAERLHGRNRAGAGRFSRRRRTARHGSDGASNRRVVAAYARANSLFRRRRGWSSCRRTCRNTNASIINPRQVAEVCHAAAR